MNFAFSRKLVLTQVQVVVLSMVSNGNYTKDLYFGLLFSVNSIGMQLRLGEITLSPNCNEWLKYK